MKQQAIYPKVSVDMFAAQGIWASGFLAVMIIVQIIRTVISTITQNDLSTFFISAFIASNIFMLVIGIIATYGFLPHFVGNGVTRKDFFKGASIGAIGLSIAIPVATYIISLIEKGIVTLIKLPVQYETAFKVSVDEDTNFIGKVFATILSPNIDFSSHLVLVLIVFSINLLTFYLIGWLIGSAFYKQIILGFVMIVFGIVVLYLLGHIMGMLLGASTQLFTLNLELPMFVLILLLIGILALCFYTVRVLTRKTVVKI